MDRLAFRRGLVVVVMLVCSAVYAWLQRPKYSSPAQVTPPAQTAPRRALPCKPSAAAGAEPRIAAPPPGDTRGSFPQLAEPRPPHKTRQSRNPRRLSRIAAGPLETKAAAVGAGAAAPNPDATVHMQIAAEEPVWMLARADGKYAFSGTLDAGETRVVEGVKDVTLRLGNAGGVSISLNGKPIGPVGPKGQTRTLQLTSGGFQIVPARPPLATARAASDGAARAAVCVPASAIRGGGDSSRPRPPCARICAK